MLDQILNWSYIVWVVLLVRFIEAFCLSSSVFSEAGVLLGGLAVMGLLVASVEYLQERICNGTQTATTQEKS